MSGRLARTLAWLTLAAACSLLIAITPRTDAASALTEPAPRSAIAAVRVPDAAFTYRRMIEQAAVDVWGVDASPARLAAQIHQESGYRPRAKSGVGAQGLAQFMPATTRWIAHEFPDQLGHFDPWDPEQAVLAAAVYDQWLLRRATGGTPCADWAFALSAYNGGERALQAEQALAGRAGASPAAWFGQVARFRARSGAAWAENRQYVRQILTVLEPAYIDAGWSGEAVCA